MKYRNHIFATTFAVALACGAFSFSNAHAAEDSCAQSASKDDGVFGGLARQENCLNQKINNRQKKAESWKKDQEKRMEDGRKRLENQQKNTDDRMKKWKEDSQKKYKKFGDDSRTKMDEEKKSWRDQQESWKKKQEEMKSSNQNGMEDMRQRAHKRVDSLFGNE
ncbi:hypothetical protein [Entomobacter blattae]|uniref:Uncharacterized protein n=1 Tax=Entomobacter blattae TaxID=2762277 RepID=A0A7H1NQ44_9PROT|nr:hypothetical protein [Entomobacter blattae]QNT77904.1 hypothetical protein JGUZn3_06620 [Entomobacter blattae]